MSPYIVKVEPLADQLLSIEFNDGETRIKDLKPVIARGNLAAPLMDSAFLRQVQIHDRGRSLLWPNGLEFCADALWLQGQKVEKNAKEYA